MTRKIFFIFLFLLLTIILIIYYLSEKRWEVSKEPYIKLYLSQKNEVINLKLEEYIKGAVAAEMPASFELEALEAQAVCIRTYTVRKILHGQKYQKGADLSDNINECQAYILKEEFKKRHPRNYKKLYKKIEEAVSGTRGIVMIYDGEPIDAVYHSTCGGRTENADEIWKNKIPYLISKKCSYCSNSPRYRDIREISYAEIKKELKIPYDVKKVSIAEKTTSGRAKKIRINDDIIIEGGYFRQKFALPSTWWEFENQGDKVLVKSRGYGHGAGMCQYGANGMAQKGYDYKEILQYYYTNVKFCKIDY